MKVGAVKSAFEGFSAPSYTPVPDELFDELMVDLSPSELRVVLYVIRRTFGFKKQEDAIALSQMLHGIRKRDGSVLDRGAGLSKPALLPALRSLIQKGILIRKHQSSRTGRAIASVYSLKFRNNEKMSIGGTGQETLPVPGKESLPVPGTESLPHKIQLPKNSQTTPPPSPSKRLVEEFYTALKLRTSPQKMGVGVIEIEKVLTGGFSEDDIRCGIQFIAKHYPDTKTISRLPFLLDEALKAKTQEETIAQRKEHISQARRLKDETTDLQQAQKCFQELSEKERDKLLSRAPRWLHINASRTAWAINHIHEQYKQHNPKGVYHEQQTCI